MSVDIDKVIETVDYGEPEKQKFAQYSEFEMRIFADLKALSDIEAVLPQVYLSIQYQLRDPKLPPNIRQQLQKRALMFEGMISPGIDEVWKFSSKKTYVALVNIMDTERLKKKMLEKLENES